LKKLNLLISKYNNEYFLIETKADILLSYGYTKEALEFYKKVLNNYPNNNYVKFNIFVKSNHSNKDIKIIDKIFFENIQLLKLFPYNADLISKFNNLSIILEYNDWTLFFEILLFEKNNFQKNLINLKNKTKDNNLKKLIKLYI